MGSWSPSAQPQVMWSDVTLWGPLWAKVLPWKQPEAAVQLATCGISKAMCKSPIKSLSCSPPSSNGSHRIIYEAQVEKTSGTTQGHKA